MPQNAQFQKQISEIPLDLKHTQTSKPELNMVISIQSLEDPVSGNRNTWRCKLRQG